MRFAHPIVLVTLSVALAVAALYAATRRLGPRREPPALHFAGLTVAAGQRVAAYGGRRGDFRSLRADSILVGLPPGVGLRVSADSAVATVVVLYDGQARCSIRVALGEGLTQPSCRGG
jgi:hypothetical protein